MTPIDDHADYRPEHASAGEAAKRLTAAITGAIEGFVEALEEHDLANEAKRGIRDASGVVRAATEESRHQAETPEMQQLGGYAKTAGAATAGAVRAASGSVKETAGHAKDSTMHTAHNVRDTVAGAAHHTADRVRDGVETAQYAAQRVKEDVKVKAEAVAETGRRARVAPGRIRHEVGEAITAWKRGLVTSIAMLLAMAIFGAITLVVLTIALVVGLNELVGDPAGTFLVALLYLVVAGVAFATARSAKAKARRETERRMENSREEARNVVRPLRDAFGRGGAGT